jgi:hypothetical protein
MPRWETDSQSPNIGLANDGIKSGSLGSKWVGAQKLVNDIIGGSCLQAQNLGSAMTLQYFWDNAAAVGLCLYKGTPCMYV